MSDEFGNSIDNVNIPVTGALALAPVGTEGPSRAEGADPNYVLPPAFRRVGLVTVDGGPEFTEERDGDPITFWQDGYSMPTGLANCTVTFTAAEDNAVVQELHAGREPDENGYVEINAGGHTNQYVLWLEEIFKNGRIRRRIAYLVTVESFTAVKSERGTVLGYTIVLRIGVSPKLNNNHYGQWYIDPAGTDPAPALSSVTPSSAAVGDVVEISGINFTDATGVSFGGVTAPAFTVDSPTKITATVPSGLTPGSHPVRVVRGNVSSSPLAFTVSE